MKVTSVEKKEKSTVELTIQVEADAFEAAVQKAYEKDRKSISVPGFRKGKAPRKIIEGMYGTGVFYEEAINQVYPGAYAQAVEEQKLDDVGYPKIEIVEVGKDGLTFKALVSVRPEVKLGTYKGLTAAKDVAKVTDKDVDEELKPYIDRATRLVSVDRAAQNGDTVVIGTGRRGADWLEKICAEHHIAHKPGTVDIGVRVECRNEVMEKVNKVLYESKLIGYPKPWKNKVRTFCQNPGGFVAQENYDNDLAVVNGHSFKEKKSENTNLAILVSHNFTEPFNQPIAYAQKVGELTNMLGAGHILVQRYGDILDGKRTWAKELARSNVRPTLPDAVAGDITSAMPYRSMLNIINFIQAVDKVVPGFAAPETLLYSPELKFYSNRIKMDTHLNTNVQGLHCLGDSSGWTRGLMMASVMGVLMGRYLL